MPNEDKEKNTGTEIVKPKIFLLHGLKFTPTPKRNNIELKFTHKITRADCNLLSFSKTKKQTILRKIFFKNNLLLPHFETDRELDHQIDVLNNLHLEEMETKSKSNLSQTEQKEPSKLSYNKTIVIKPTDMGGVVVILSRSHYQNIIMQHRSDENTHKKLGSCIDNKIQYNLLRFLSQHKMSFIEPEWKFLSGKHHEVSNFYRLPKIHKSMIIASTINTQNSEIIEIFEPNDLKLRPIIAVLGVRQEKNVY